MICRARHPVLGLTSTSSQYHISRIDEREGGNESNISEGMADGGQLPVQDSNDTRLRVGEGGEGRKLSFHLREPVAARLAQSAVLPSFSLQEAG